jgi:hypothetical protein
MRKVRGRRRWGEAGLGWMIVGASGGGAGVLGLSGAFREEAGRRKALLPRGVVEGWVVTVRRVVAVGPEWV